MKLLSFLENSQHFRSNFYKVLNIRVNKIVLVLKRFRNK